MQTAMCRLWRGQLSSISSECTLSAENTDVPRNRPRNGHEYISGDMSDADLEIPDDEPEAVRLHAALAVAVLALELIADDGRLNHPAMARAALGHLARHHPVSREHIDAPKPAAERA